MIHSILHGLDDALLGEPTFPLIHFYSYTLLLFSLVSLTEAFPGSSNAMTVAVEYNIICDKDSKAELSSVELAASVKG
jgi:hypothetical protein